MGSGIGIWMWVEVVCFFPFPWWYFDISDTESIRFAKRSCETSRLQPPAPSHLTATLHWWWHCWHNYSQCVAAWSGQGPGLPCNIIYSRRRQLPPVAHTLPHIATIATQRNVASTLPQWDHSRKTIFWFWTMIRTSELLRSDHLSLLHVTIFATLDSKSFLYIYLNFTK